MYIHFQLNKGSSHREQEFQEEENEGEGEENEGKKKDCRKNSISNFHHVGHTQLNFRSITIWPGEHSTLSISHLRRKPPPRLAEGKEVEPKEKEEETKRKRKGIETNEGGSVGGARPVQTGNRKTSAVVFVNYTVAISEVS